MSIMVKFYVFRSTVGKALTFWSRIVIVILQYA